MSDKVNSSLVYKLNAWHIGRMLGAFLATDILIVLIFAGIWLYQTEEDFSRLTSSGLDGRQGASASSRYVSGYEAGPPASADRWIEKTFDRMFRGGHPEERRTVGRVYRDGALADGWQAAFDTDSSSAETDGTGIKGILQNFKGVYYKLWIPDEAGGFLTIRTDMGEDLQRLASGTLILLAVQIISVIVRIGKDARAIRRKLRPIAELAQTAKNISAAGFSPGGNANGHGHNATHTGEGAHSDAEAIRNIAGTISAIDVDRLDKRITVDETENELKELAASINDMLNRIDRAYQAQIRFVSDASHELRTPIAVIQGYANLLDRWGKNDEKALSESIDAIKSEADHMKNLIEQLLFLARGDADTVELHKENFDMAALAEEVLREMTMIDPHHIFTSKLAEKAEAFADEQLIKQAVRIFMDNSVKYTPEGGMISIAVRVEEKETGQNEVVTDIQDNGIGIAPQDIPFIFDRFFRSDESRTRKTGGAGLGMAIAKWIIDWHSGSLEVISRQDFGTRITFRLPAKDKTERKAEEKQDFDLQNEEKSDILI